MMRSVNPDLDLTISRVIKRHAVIWSMDDPSSFEQPGSGAPAPASMHLRLRWLVRDPDQRGRRRVRATPERLLPRHRRGRADHLTNALLGGWRPAEHPFMTAIITLQEHPQGTEYVAHAMHKNEADRTMHEQMGFADGGHGHGATRETRRATGAIDGAPIARATRPARVSESPRQSAEFSQRRSLDCIS